MQEFGSRYSYTQPARREEEKWACWFTCECSQPIQKLIDWETCNGQIAKILTLVWALINNMTYFMVVIKALEGLFIAPNYYTTEKMIENH